MGYYSQEDEVTKRPFLFISYRHDDKVFVEQDAQWLRAQGVRIWYDDKLHSGDDWELRVKTIISHENCCGVLFYNSPASFCSDPVYKERAYTMEELKKRGEGKFFYIPINVGAPTTMLLLKKLFADAPDDTNGMDKYFKAEWLVQILDLFRSTVMYIHADTAHPDAHREKLLDDIREKAPSVIYSGAANSDTIRHRARSKNGVPCVSLGRWLGEETNAPGIISTAQDGEFPFKGKVYRIYHGKAYMGTQLDWFILLIGGEKALLVSTALIAINKFGTELQDWLQNEFFGKAFTPEEQQLFAGPIRLLQEEEYLAIEDPTVLADPETAGNADSSYWWIDSKGIGNNQKVVKSTDGVLYNNGIPRNKAVGVRPVIEIDCTTLIHILEG